MIVGRWAQSGGKVKGEAYDQEHAKAEFYAQEVGWVPVDISSGVLHDRNPRGLTFFGNDPGDFLVMHVDPDIVCDTLHFGRQTIAWLQRPAYWVTGEGNLRAGTNRESWVVKKVPPPALVEASLKQQAGPEEKPAFSSKPRARRGPRTAP